VINESDFVVRVAYEAHDILGEGPLWDDQRNGLWWCDLKRSLVRFLSAATGQVHNYQIEGNLGSIAMCTDGSILVAASAIWFLDPESDKCTRAYDLPPGSLGGVRCNDGRVDRHGRFWVGTMDNEEKESLGTDWILTNRGWEHGWRSAVGVPNAHCFSPDGDTAYWADSWAGTIIQLALSAETGAIIGDETPFATTEKPGGPDGACVDAHGYLWNAEWGGGRLTRYAPNGDVSLRLNLPAPRPTCPVFGGPNFGTLYLTTASWNLDPSDPAFGSSGSLLAIDTGAQGIYGRVEHRFIR
jgi:L-arabinonolactonase